MDVARVLVAMTERRKAAQDALELCYVTFTGYGELGADVQLDRANQLIGALAVWDEAIILLGEALAERQARPKVVLTLGTVVAS